MKTISVFTCLYLALIGINAYAQDSIQAKIDSVFSDIQKDIDQTERDSLILTQRAFNRVAGKSISSYLSSSNDVTFAKTYAILDNTDNRLFVGGNIPFRNKKTDRIYTLLSLGVKSDISEKVSELYNKEELTNDISAEVKFTFPIFFWIKYDKNYLQKMKMNALRDTSQRDKMHLERIKILQTMKAKSKKEVKDLSESLNGIADKKDSIQIIANHIEEMKEDVEELFYEQEALAFDKSKKTFSNSYKTGWLSIASSIPISEKKYTVAETYGTKPRSVYYYPLNGSARLTFLHDWYKYVKYFINVSYIAGKSNTILDNEIKQEIIENVTQLDSTRSVTTESKVYFTPFKQTFSDRLKGQFIFYPKPDKNKFIGLDILGNYELSSKDAYWGLGIPVSLQGKDEKSIINFEVIVNRINQPSKRTVSISLAIPFGSIIY